VTEDRMLQALAAIRDEVRASNARLEAIDRHVQAIDSSLESVEGRLERIEGHAAGLGDRFDRMARRQTESELRLSTEVLARADVTRQVRDLLATRLDDHHAVLEHERRLAELEKRTP